MEGAKVLPTNEFFNLSDTDCQSEQPKSIVGQYLKPLNEAERQDLQRKIDLALGRPNGRYRTGYAYGHTVAVNHQSEQLLFTNTVKYDERDTGAREEEAGRQTEAVSPNVRDVLFSNLALNALAHDVREYLGGVEHLREAKRLREPELTQGRVGFGLPFPREPQREPGELRESVKRMCENLKGYRKPFHLTLQQMEDQRYRTHVHYDTCLLAIGQCIPAIISLAHAAGVHRLLIPLLGAGWGGLGDGMVFWIMCTHLFRAIAENSDAWRDIATDRKLTPLDEITIVVGPTTTIDRAIVLHCIQEAVTYATGSTGESLEAQELIRLLQQESDSVQDRIKKYKDLGKSPPENLLARKKELRQRKRAVERSLGKGTKNVKIVKGDDVKGNRDSHDTYIVKQAGSVGPGSIASNMVFQQFWSDNARGFDLKSLTTELSQLRSKMREAAEGDSGHDIAIGHIAAAQEAATRGDGADMLEHLQKAGKWALSFAQNVGASLVAAAISRATELSA